MKSTPEDVEAGKREAVKVLEQRHRDSAYFKPEQSEIRNLLFACIHTVMDKREIDTMDNQALASKIAGWTGLYSVENNEVEITNLLKLKREELLAIYKVMDYTFYLKRMRSSIKSLGL